MLAREVSPGYSGCIATVLPIVRRWASPIAHAGHPVPSPADQTRDPSHKIKFGWCTLQRGYQYRSRLSIARNFASLDAFPGPSPSQRPRHCPLRPHRFKSRPITSLRRVPSSINLDTRRIRRSIPSRPDSVRPGVRVRAQVRPRVRVGVRVWARPDGRGEEGETRRSEAWGEARKEQRSSVSVSAFP